MYVRRRDPQVRLTPLFDGGGHERGFRSGTLPSRWSSAWARPSTLAVASARPRPTRLLDAARAAARGDRRPGRRRSGSTATRRERLPGNLNLSFADVDGEALMMAMRDVAVSSGSACTSANPEPSHVLRAMGLDEDLARASLRFGLGRFTTAEEIDFADRRRGRRRRAAPRPHRRGRGRSRRMAWDLTRAV